MQTLSLQDIIDGIRQDAFMQGAQQMRELLAQQLEQASGHTHAQNVRGWWPIEWGCDPGPFLAEETLPPHVDTFELPAPDRTGTLGSG